VFICAVEIAFHTDAPIKSGSKLPGVLDEVKTVLRVIARVALELFPQRLDGGLHLCAVQALEYAALAEKRALLLGLRPQLLHQDVDEGVDHGLLAELGTVALLELAQELRLLVEGGYLPRLRVRAEVDEVY